MLVATRLTLLVFIAAGCSRQPHEPLQAISSDVRAGRLAAAAKRIAAADLPDRPRLAFRAAADAPAAQLDALAAAALEPELAAAVADRLEQELGPRAALAARERAAAAAPERAEHHDALARARLAAEQLDPALAAWDRAAALAPLQPTYRLAPIRALVALGQPARACARAAALAEAARAAAPTAAPTAAAEARVVESFLLASNAAAACGDRPRAVELARAALAARPGDGRLAFTVGERLADAAAPEAAAALTELLVCGARGRPWHRHEVAARLLAFAATPAAAPHVLAALDAPRRCEPVAPQDLAGYVSSLRERIAQLPPAPPAPPAP